MPDLNLLGPPGFQPNNTLLNIIPLSGHVGLVLTPYAARGLTQTYKQINPAGSQNIRRTVIGTLVNLTPPWFHQYATTISCTDVNTPAIDTTWRGHTFEVHCAAELNYTTGGTPDRPVVSGSSRTEGSMTFYRPIMIMMLMDFDVSFREYDGLWTWRIDLEETYFP